MRSSQPSKRWRNDGSKTLLTNLLTPEIFLRFLKDDGVGVFVRIEQESPLNRFIPGKILVGLDDVDIMSYERLYENNV
jgi:hypothetical protein